MGSRLWPSKVMKIGLRVSSSRRHSPSLRRPDCQERQDRPPGPPPQANSPTHRKLWLHQGRLRKASERTTMRRRQRLRFTKRSAEGSVGKGVDRRMRGGASDKGGVQGTVGMRRQDLGGTRARQEVAVLQEELVSPTPLQLRLQNKIYKFAVLWAVTIGHVRIV